MRCRGVGEGGECGRTPPSRPPRCRRRCAPRQRPLAFPSYRAARKSRVGRGGERRPRHRATTTWRGGGLRERLEVVACNVARPPGSEHLRRLVGRRRGRIASGGRTWMLGLARGPQRPCSLWVEPHLRWIRSRADQRQAQGHACGKLSDDPHSQMSGLHILRGRPAAPRGHGPMVGERGYG